MQDKTQTGSQDVAKLMGMIKEIKNNTKTLEENSNRLEDNVRSEVNALDEKRTKDLINGKISSAN